MGRIAVYEFMAIDGVYEDPSWTMEFGFDPAMGEALGAGMAKCKALLLGRRTYEAFYPAWSTRSAEDDPGAPFFNDSPKHVVSSTLTDPEWSNTTVLGPYSADAVRGLKDGIDDDIYVTGSGTLVRALLADGLVDDLHLMVFPVARGTGARLFGEDEPTTKLSLQESEAYDNGVVHLSYGTAG